MKKYFTLSFPLLLFLSGTVYAGVYQAPLQTHPSQGEVRVIDGSSASLFSFEDGIAMSLQTKGLVPGHVYTLWFVVMNYPEACAAAPGLCKPADVLERTAKTGSDVIYADGVVADESGLAAFNAYIPRGNSDAFWFGNGLQKTTSAEVHLVINDHGPSRLDNLGNMLTSYRGGCSDDSLPAAFPAVAKADGRPGPNRCRMVQVVRFQQN